MSPHEFDACACVRVFFSFFCHSLETCMNSSSDSCHYLKIIEIAWCRDGILVKVINSKVPFEFPVNAFIPNYYCSLSLCVYSISLARYAIDQSTGGFLFVATSFEGMGSASIIKWSLDWTEQHACSPCLYKYHFSLHGKSSPTSIRPNEIFPLWTCVLSIYLHKVCENCIKSSRIQSYQPKWKECWNIQRNIFIFFYFFSFISFHCD